MMSLQSPSYDLFLSYNGLEEGAAAYLEEKLRDQGIRVFLARRQLLPGARLQTEISQALMVSARFALLLGPSGIGDWQSHEIDAAFELAVGEDTSRMILVLTLPGADLGNMPALLRPRLRIHFASGVEDSQAFQKLLAGIVLDPGCMPGSLRPLERAHDPRCRAA